MKNVQTSEAPVTGSKFKLNFAATGKVVTSGKRVSSDTIAQIECQSQMNKFGMNKLAADMIGAGAGSRIKIIVTNAPTLDGKYFVVKCAADDTKGAKIASATGKDTSGSFNFNYAGVYSQMQQSEVDAIEKSGETLVAEGVAIAKESGANKTKVYYLDHKTIFEIVPIEDFNEENPFDVIDEEGKVVESFTEVFALINAKVEAVDNTKETKPRAKKEDAVEVEATDAVTLDPEAFDFQADAVED